MFGRKTFANMHAWVDERLSDYIDNQLSASDRAQFDKHLSECSPCRASLESMKWTVALMKQTPVVTTRRSFVLPVPVKRQPTWAFGFASFAAVAATLLLFALIGIDLITQLGGGYSVAAPAAAPFVAQQKFPAASSSSAGGLLAAPTFAPMPTSAPKAMSAAPASSSSSQAAPFAASSSAAASSSSAASSASLAPAPVAQPTHASTLVAPTVVAESATNAAQDNLKSQTTTMEPRQALTGSAIVGTATPSPTWTATPSRTPTTVPPSATLAPTATLVPPTATLAPTATFVPPTATPQPTRIAQVENQTSRAPGAQSNFRSEPVLSPLRLAQIGAFFGAIFFGVLVLLLRRR